MRKDTMNSFKAETRCCCINYKLGHNSGAAIARLSNGLSYIVYGIPNIFWAIRTPAILVRNMRICHITPKACFNTPGCKGFMGIEFVCEMYCPDHYVTGVFQALYDIQVCNPARQRLNSPKSTAMKTPMIVAIMTCLFLLLRSTQISQAPCGLSFWSSSYRSSIREPQYFHFCASFCSPFNSMPLSSVPLVICLPTFGSNPSVDTSFAISLLV